MSLATSLKKIAGQVIKQFGDSVTIRYITPGAYNTATGVSGETTSDLAVTAVIEAFSEKDQRSATAGAGDKARAHRFKVYVSASQITTVPDNDDRVVFDSLEHEITRVEKIKSGGDILYMMEVAR